MSKITTYDCDELLYWTKIGENSGEMTLLCAVCGKTVTESRQRAEKILIAINYCLGNVKEQK